VLADVELGLGQRDAGPEDPRPALARVLGVARHELLALGDVVELHLDLAVIQRLGEEGQVLEIPGALVGPALLGRPDLVDLVFLQRADERALRGEAHRKPVLRDDDLPLEHILRLGRRAGASAGQNEQGSKDGTEPESKSFVHLLGLPRRRRFVERGVRY
jgi:hypothetical protein